MKADAHIRGRELIVITARVQTKSIQQGNKKENSLLIFIWPFIYTYQTVRARGTISTGNGVVEPGLKCCIMGVISLGPNEGADDRK